MAQTETYRAPYDPEAEFYSYVRQGNTEKVKELCRESFQEKKGLGILSDSPLQNLKYHFAITAAMLARYCIEGGMEVTEAYDLSDYYIHKADLMKSKKEISTLHPQMCLDYTTRMEKMHRNHACSRPVAQCLEYIYDHLHNRITVPTLAVLLLTKMKKCDYYIHKADLMKSKKEISALHPQMCLDYTTRMEKMHRNHACPPTNPDT